MIYLKHNINIFPENKYIGLLLCIFMASCMGVVYFAILLNYYHKNIKHIPYVPPVTSDTLPAEEVLVRGSEEPTQEQSKVLLRGTECSMGTGEQELLRSSQGQGPR